MATDDETTRAQEPGEDETPHGLGSDLCSVGFCPVSMLLTATGTVQPELIQHLLAAGRELLLAAQLVVNARAEGFERRSPLEKIEIG